jgi:hypothetical protein
MRHRVDVERLRAGHDDVVATAVERVAGTHGDVAVAARVAGDLEAADDALAEEAAVVQAALGRDVLAEQPEVFLGQQLTGEETRAHVRLGARHRHGGLARPAAAAAAVAVVGGAHSDSSPLRMKNQLSKLPGP